MRFVVEIYQSQPFSAAMFEIGNFGGLVISVIAFHSHGSPSRFPLTHTHELPDIRGG